jgi:3-hydroxybutyryl-CoA dehydrogenase
MEIRTVLIVGAGTMGHGIAHVAALAGCDALLYDVDPGVVARGREAIDRNLAKGVARGKVTEADREAALARVQAAPTDLAEAATAADLVVEAVPERLELKQQIFTTLGEAAPEHAILATNTSSLPVTEIGAASGRPGRVVGMHFFNPVHIMKLLELVTTKATEPEVVEASKAIGHAMGKTVIVVKDSPGFATSRLGLALGLEAMRMVEERVASPQDIDTAMELGYGHPVGPLKLTDIVGLDVRLSIAEHLAEVLDDRRFEPPALLRRLVAEGKLGRKSGEGFFGWPEQAATAK